jgi:hypothetical protein
VARPKEFDSAVSLRIRRELHDEMSREALKRRIDLADVMRERLSIGFRISKREKSERAVRL